MHFNRQWLRKKEYEISVERETGRQIERKISAEQGANHCRFHIIALILANCVARLTELIRSFFEPQLLREGFDRIESKCK